MESVGVESEQEMDRDKASVKNKKERVTWRGKGLARRFGTWMLGQEM